MELLLSFDDLIFSKKYAALRKSLGMPVDFNSDEVPEEFEEIDPSITKSKNQTKKRKTAPQRRGKGGDVDFELPTEDPLAT